MNTKKEFLVRYIIMGAFFIVFAFVFAGRLINIEITGQGYVTDTSYAEYRTRTEKIQALRGEIYDRNGKPLVTNEYSYDVYFEAGSMNGTNVVKNRIILSVLKAAEECGQYEKVSLPTYPFLELTNVSGTQTNYEYDPSFMATVYGGRLEKMLLELTEEEELPPASEAVELLLVRYGLVDSEGRLNYSKEKVTLLFGIRLDMELKNFSPLAPYTIVTDADMTLMTRLREDALRGVAIETKVERVYNYPGYASHILGRTGKIQAAKADYYTELGYPLDAIVGISGAEEAFESYLRGIDGEKTVIEDEYGNVIDEYVSKEAVPGKNVYLTLDIDLQIAAEKALESNIQLIVENAVASGEELSGEDANAGAMSVVKVKTGEVLALASYPTYNLATFNEDYEELRTNELSPMFNRALEGTYAPGSTFKPGVAAAALQEGIVGPYTLLPCNGPYKYYEDSGFTPACWVWNMRRGSHGLIDVTEAIQVSCNCYFYEVGRLLTIGTMNKYCTGYGLGQPTGIELDEKTGVLAGPEYRDENGLEAWTPGQTITAAIGQSDNLFTPLQISQYIATIINGGDRMSAHMLYEVHEFGSDEPIDSFEPQIIDDSVSLSESVVNIVKGGMKNVMEDGSAARVFRNYPITIGGKTGTAQVREDRSDNAIFTAFAPFSDPEIVASCVIEQGASGTDAGYAIKDVFDRYFGFETADAEAETEEADGEDENEAEAQE